MKGFGGGMQNLMKQANQMQAKMKKVQEELAAREYEAQAGGGGISVKVNGDNQITSITINPEVLEGGDAEMLQDLVKAATNEALKLAKDTHQQEMAKITGGFNMPGMF